MLKKLRKTHLLLGLTIFSGCGRQEGASGTLGTVSGALIGASVAGKRDTLAGAAIGGLVGHMVGSSIGRAADDQEAAEINEVKERIRARELAATKAHAQEIAEENRRLRQSHTKWCARCWRQSTVIGAHSCTSCGGALISQLNCQSCQRAYSPTTQYRCCPYCRGGIPLYGC
jgi:hypothetical protein